MLFKEYLATKGITQVDIEGLLQKFINFIDLFQTVILSVLAVSDILRLNKEGESTQQGS